MFIYLLHLQYSFYTLYVAFQKQSEKFATASGDNVVGANNLESDVVAVSSGNPCLIPQFSAAHSSSIVLNAEFASHVASYNIVCFVNLA